MRHPHSFIVQRRKVGVPAGAMDEDRLKCGQISLNQCTADKSIKAMEIHSLIPKQCPQLLPSQRAAEGQRGKQVTADLLFTVILDIKL